MTPFKWCCRSNQDELHFAGPLQFLDWCAHLEKITLFNHVLLEVIDKWFLRKFLFRAVLLDKMLTQHPKKCVFWSNLDLCITVMSLEILIFSVFPLKLGS